LFSWSLYEAALGCFLGIDHMEMKAIKQACFSIILEIYHDFQLYRYIDNTEVDVRRIDGYN
jgi:hypothetical protein